MPQLADTSYDILLKVYGFFCIYLIGLVGLFRQYCWLYRYRSGTWDIPGGTDKYARGRRVLITGGVGVIGLKTARSLIGFDCDVVIVDKVPNEEAMKRLKKELGSAKHKVTYYNVDLRDLDAVKELSSRIVADKLVPDVLLCNAGIMHTPYEIVNRDNAACESQFTVSYLAHVLLLLELAPHLDACRRPRMVFVSSLCHTVNYVNLDDVNGAKGYSAHLWYAQTKLCQVAFVRFLASRDTNGGFNGFHFTAIHPGIIDSGLYEHVVMRRLLAPFYIMTPAEGAICSVHACLSPTVKSGDYLTYCEPTAPATKACDMKIQKKLLLLTTRLLKPYTNVESLY